MSDLLSYTNAKCKCGNEYEYVERYDAFICRACDKWIEVICLDPECQFCPERPSKPSMIEKNNEETK